MAEPLETTVVDGVMTVTLNMPADHNRIDRRMMAAITGAMETAGSSAKTFEDQIQELVDSGSTLNEALAKVLATSTELSGVGRVRTIGSPPASGQMRSAAS